MTRSITRIISRNEEKLIELLIAHASPEQRKRGLQRFCLLYEQGVRFSNVRPIALTLNGLLFGQPKKVRRWALRAIALLRDKAANFEAVAALAPTVADNPEILSWAVASLFAITSHEEALRVVSAHGIPINGALLLASAQYSEDLKKELASNRVNINGDSPLELRLASLLLGFNIAPEFMFSARHKNRSIVGELNCHPDNLVAQYSVWAIRENPEFGISDLGFQLKNIEGRPANVRNWTYQLVAGDADTFSKNLDLLECAAFDDESKAREGMAAGIRERWVRGIDGIIVDWAGREDDDATKSHLYEHMAAQSDLSPTYSDLIRQVYQDARSNALQRKQIEVAASGTLLFSEVQRIQIGERHQHDMFLLNESDRHTNVQQFFNTGGGPIHIGANAPSGEIAVQSQQTLSQTTSTIVLSNKLEEALGFVRSADISPTLRQNAENALDDAKSDQTPGRVRKAIEAIKAIKDATVNSEQIISASIKIIDALNKWCN